LFLHRIGNCILATLNNLKDKYHYNQSENQETYCFVFRARHKNATLKQVFVKVF